MELLRLYNIHIFKYWQLFLYLRIQIHFINIYVCTEMGDISHPGPQNANIAAMNINRRQNYRWQWTEEEYLYWLVAMTNLELPKANYKFRHVLTHPTMHHKFCGIEKFTFSSTPFLLGP